MERRSTSGVTSASRCCCMRPKEVVGLSAYLGKSAGYKTAPLATPSIEVTGCRIIVMGCNIGYGLQAKPI